MADLPKYPEAQQKIVDRVGPSWCFEHGEAMPCVECANKPPFLGLCFDCKRELAGDEEEPAEECGCGDRVRLQRVYRYP
jgi:hypothetical protein